MASRQPTADDDLDFFPTPPWGARAGAELIKRLDPRVRRVWEPACGAGHMVHGLKDYFADVCATDVAAYDGNLIGDFLDDDWTSRAVTWFQPDWIVTNFAFSEAEEFVRRAWDLAPRGVAMLARAGFIETVGRYSLLYRDCPLTVFAPFSERLPMCKGRWEPDGSTAAFYAWFVWLKPEMRPQRFMARIGNDYYPATVPIPPGTAARLTHPDDSRLFGATDRAKVAL